MRHTTVLLAASLILTTACAGTEQQPPSEATAEQETMTADGTQVVEHASAGYTPGTWEDWCGEHQVPESQCTRCSPSLTVAFKATGDWCAEHQLPESQCLKCNPGLVIERPGAPGAAHAPEGYTRGTWEDWCGGHQVPESQCTRCNPSLVAAFKATGDWCAEHQLPESQCLACNPGLQIERPPRVASQ